MQKLTEEQIAAKAEELAKKFNTKVTPIVLDVDGDQVVGYLKKPNYRQLMYANDCLLTQRPTDGTENIIRANLIREESDERIYNEDPANDEIRASAVLAAFATIKLYANTFNETLKKN